MRPTQTVRYTALVVLIGIVLTGPAAAQTFTPPKFNYSYGYQPYNDRNPTGFNHPNGMGYGRYVYDNPHKGHRSKALSYRRFRGY